MLSRKFISAVMLIVIYLETSAETAIVRIQTGYRNLSSSSNSFKIDAPTAVNIGLGYFLTNNLALDGSIETVWGKFEYTHLLYKIKGDESGRILYIINIAAQYHFNRDNQFKPYIGIGYSHQLKTTFYSSFAQDKEIFSIGGGGNILMQLGLDIKLTKDCYFNIDFKHMLPVSQVLDVVELNIKPKHNISNSEIVLGVAVSI